MEKLRLYLKSLPTAEKNLFAQRCGTTYGYLRKAMSTGQPVAEKTCINIERESGGAVRVEDLRTDVDWAVIRNSPAPAEA